MKITTLAIATLASFLLGTATEAADNPQECVDPSTINADTDLFPVKANVKYSKQWSVSYHKTYKILTNIANDETYLLYQCGTTPPSVDEVGNHTQTFPIPLERIVLSSTTHIPNVEQIGERTKIAGYYGSTESITSPCLSTMLDAGHLTELKDPADTSVHSGDSDTADAHIDTFLSTYPDTPVLKDFPGGGGGNALLTSEWKEKGNKATYEWLKMYGVLFNREKEAEEVYDSFESRYDCLTENAALIADDKPDPADGSDDTPNVLWAYRVNYVWNNVNFVYWDVRACSGDPTVDNNYCDFAKHCHAELENPPDDDGNFVAVSKSFYNDAEFFNFAAKAEYWIYPGFDFNDVYLEYKSQMDTLPSVQNKKVYDVLGSGQSTWYEQRMVEADVVLGDFCQVVEHIDEIAIPHERKYFRKALPAGEEPAGSLGPLGTCLIDDIEEPLTSRAGACFKYVGQTDPSALCDDDQDQVTITIQTDGKGDEIYWFLKQYRATQSRFFNVELSGKNKYEDNKLYVEDYCVKQNKCMRFVIKDTTSKDGLCCDFGNGFWRVDLNGEKLKGKKMIGVKKQTYEWGPC